jgi:hypothetical protein
VAPAARDADFDHLGNYLMDFKLLRAKFEDGSVLDSEASLATAKVSQRGERVVGARRGGRHAHPSCSRVFNCDTPAGSAHAAAAAAAAAQAAPPPRR